VRVTLNFTAKEVQRIHRFFEAYYNRYDDHPETFDYGWFEFMARTFFWETVALREASSYVMPRIFRMQSREWFASLKPPQVPKALADQLAALDVMRSSFRKHFGP